MKVWMYYVTDDDSGYYRIRLFSTEEKAKLHQRKMNDPYSDIIEIEVK